MNSIRGNIRRSVMKNHVCLISVFAVSTALAGAAYAANTDAASTTGESPAQGAALRDAGKLSADGMAAFRDLHMTRLAIFDADPAQAKSLISKAQSELGKAKTDETVFTKAESELKQPVAASGTNAQKPQDTSANPDMKKPTAWLPIDGQLVLSDDFVATPQKAAAVTEANKALAKGDQKAALDRLKLADVNVSFTMAIVPLTKTINDVDQAATLINQGKYYEANASLKQAEDGVRFDVADVNAVPQAQQAHNAKSTGAAEAPAKSQ
jgi:hypothetical protein